eukprot:2031174-Rhodomonas_salina.1
MMRRASSIDNCLSSARMLSHSCSSTFARYFEPPLAMRTTLSGKFQWMGVPLATARPTAAKSMMTVVSLTGITKEPLSSGSPS